MCHLFAEDNTLPMVVADSKIGIKFPVRVILCKVGYALLFHTLSVNAIYSLKK